MWKQSWVTQKEHRGIVLAWGDVVKKAKAHLGVEPGRGLEEQQGLLQACLQ